MGDTVTVKKKNILKSKTFWFNVLTIGAGFMGVLPAPVLTYAVPVVNVLLRSITQGPVTILPTDSNNAN